MLCNADYTSVWDCGDYQTWKNSTFHLLTALLQILCAQEDINDNDSRLNLVHKPSNILSMTFFFIYADEQFTSASGWGSKKTIWMAYQEHICTTQL